MAPVPRPAGQAQAASASPAFPQSWLTDTFEFGVLEGPLPRAMQTLFSSLYQPILEVAGPSHDLAATTSSIASIPRGGAVSAADEKASVSEGGESGYSTDHAQLGRRKFQMALRAEVAVSLNRLSANVSQLISTAEGAPVVETPNIPEEQLLRVIAAAKAAHDTPFASSSGASQPNGPPGALGGAVGGATGDLDLALLTRLEGVVTVWTKTVAAVVDAELTRNSQAYGKTPMGELTFWRARVGALSALHEQLGSPKVKLILRALQAAESVARPAFDGSFSNLSKLYLEARDIVKFLSTLERHFRALEPPVTAVTSQGSLGSVADTIGSLLTALKLVWFISRSFNTDERMMSLLEKVAHSVADRVARHVNIRQTLRMPPAEAVRRVTEGRAVLIKWRTAYLAVRDEVEKAERGQRWEFDRGKLFGLSDYMTARCDDLLEIAGVVEFYQTVFGSRIRALTPDVQGLNAVMLKVHELTVPIEAVSFDVFDQTSAPMWDAVMITFKNRVAAVDRATKKFVDVSFATLPSAFAQFNLLLSLRALGSASDSRAVTAPSSAPPSSALTVAAGAGASSSSAAGGGGGSAGLRRDLLHLHSKVDDVLRQFEREVAAVEEQFHHRRDMLVLPREQPPVAGATLWSEALLLRLKVPAIRFQQEDILASQLGREVRKKYVEVGRAIKAYQASIQEAWSTDVEATVGVLLRTPLLVRVGPGDLAVNADPRLAAAVLEARALDRLGYDCSPAALNAGLFGDELHAHVNALRALVGAYRSAIASVGPAERSIVAPHVARLDAAMQPGCDTFSWTSLGISSFVSRATAAVDAFQSVLTSTSKSSDIVMGLVNSIAATNLMPPAASLLKRGGEPLEISALVETIEAHKTQKLAVAVRMYASIPPLLRKVEGVVVETNSGKAPSLSDYYAHWERFVGRAIVKMVLQSLASLKALLVPSQRRAAGQHSRKRATAPLFRLAASLVFPEIVLSPSTADVQAALGRIVRLILDSPKAFVRWMAGTCIEATMGELNLKAGEELDPSLTFMPAVDDYPVVGKLRSQINGAVQRSNYYVNKHVQSYKRFQTVWSNEKQLFIDKLLPKGLSWVEYDQRFEMYSKSIVHLLYTFPDTRDVGFVTVDTAQFHAELQGEARLWIVGEGKQLHDIYRPKIQRLAERLRQLAKDVSQPVDGIEDLKFVLSIIEMLQAQALETELAFTEIEHVMNSLARYDIPVSEEDRATAFALRGSWEALVAAAAKRDVDVAGVKERFKRVTVKDVAALRLQIQRSLENFMATGPGVETEDLGRGLDAVNDWKAELAEKISRREALVKSERLLGLPVTTHEGLLVLERELVRLDSVYSVYADWKSRTSGWIHRPWSDMPLEAMVKGTDAFLAQLKKMPANLKDTAPYEALRKLVANFGETLPLARDLRSEAMRDRHWKQLTAATGVEIDMGTFSLSSLLAMKLWDHRDVIAVIVSGAQRELELERSIQKIQSAWRTMTFDLLKMDRNGLDRGYILNDCTAIQERVDDDVMSLQAMANVRWVRPFADQVSQLERKLAVIGEVIGVWQKVQQQWLYVECIFVGTDDIAERLPREAKRFAEVDAAWLQIMQRTQRDPTVDAACHADQRLSVLRQLLAKLEQCRRGLALFLNAKRMGFPRFYFLSDEELLALLAVDGVAAVRDHLNKLFDNVGALHFRGDASSNTIVGVSSHEGEVVTLKAPVFATGLVIEAWLTLFLAELRRTVQLTAKAAVFYCPKERRLAWLQKHSGQSCSLASLVWWTFQMEDAFVRMKRGDKGAIKQLEGRLTEALNEVVSQMTTDIDAAHRKKLNTMIIIDVHSRDIVSRFVRDAVQSTSDFEWESQLRFYWDRTSDSCVIRQCTGTFAYGNEYSGLSGRLVVTPLTDRCFMTLTQALSMYLGASPAGPAGTGKTESVKDLAKALGIFCVVFNCGGGLDYRGMGLIFSGLAQCGAWGCFDEFNRIDLPVLSVVAEQLRTLQAALKMRAPTFQLMDVDMPLHPAVGVFVTMNPGYAGRVELPDNLKALFRPVVMVLPDLDLICEIMLFAEGFVTARPLAKKMVTLYSVARTVLSRCSHYDWGLRALKSVLVMAGALKRGAPDKPEDAVLMRALRDMNAPKFVLEDVEPFRGLLEALFPGLGGEKAVQQQEAFKRTIGNVMRAKGLTLVPAQVDKVAQLFDVMLTRHTTMVVGPSGGGKSVVIRALQAAQTELRVHTKVHVVNPKAMPVSALYGVLDSVSRNWTDGVFSLLFRTVNTPHAAERHDGGRNMHIILFDGDVDAIWVENLNSVMDENKILTLPNGERIRLMPSTQLLFEVGHLQHASPATVSRSGMTFVDGRLVSWQAPVRSWLARRDKDDHDVLHELLLQKYLKPMFDFIFDGVGVDGERSNPPALAVQRSEVALVAQFTSLFESLAADVEGLPPIDSKGIESCVIFSAIWALGGLLGPSDRVRFDRIVRDTCGWPTADPGDKFDRAVGAGALPERGTLFDYQFSRAENRWYAWQTLVTPYAPPRDPHGAVLVSTPDTVRNLFLLSCLCDAGCPVLFVGPPSTAKSACINAHLASCPDTAADAARVKASADGAAKAQAKTSAPSTSGSKGQATGAPTGGGSGGDRIPLGTIARTVALSSRTSACDLRESVAEMLEKRSASCLGPPAGRRLLLFIDDLHMPTADAFDSMEAIAFLRLLIEGGGWYDPEDLHFRTIKDVNYLAAMAPPGGARASVDPRLLAHFHCYSVPVPTDASVASIYRQILGAHLAAFPEEYGAVVAPIVTAALSVQHFVTTSLLPTPSKWSYVFNMRDLTSIFQGILRSTPEKFDTPVTLVRLWRNETLRVLCDRMSDPEDKVAVDGVIATAVNESWKAHSGYIMTDPCLYGTILDFGKDDAVSAYEDLVDTAMLRPIVEAVLEDMNAPTVRLDLVVFDSMIELFVKVLRVFSQPRAHALLVGVGGSGRQSTARLAAHAVGASFWELSLTRNFNDEALREALKGLYRQCGVDDKPTVFFFADSHVQRPSFLQAVNSMLTAGIVPSLFTDEERDACTAQIATDLEAAGVPATREARWTAFLNRCRDRLHICLSSSPSGDTLRLRCRDFPGLLSATTMVAFPTWPPEALAAVATKRLSDPQLAIPPKLAPTLADLLVSTYQSASSLAATFEVDLRRRNRITPRNFLDALAQYRHLLLQRRGKIDEAATRLATGLDRLLKASADVANMTTQLNKQEIFLSAKVKENDDLLSEIQAKKAAAVEKRAIAVDTEGMLSQQKIEIEANKKDAEEALSEAMPQLEEAQGALERVQKKDIDEIKVMSNPPEKVAAVGEMVCILRGVQPSWNEAKAFMQAPNFVTLLKTFPKETLSDKKIVAVQKRFPDLSDETIGRSSKAAVELYRWVIAMEHYYKVAKKVEPKRQLVLRLERHLKDSERELAQTQAEVLALTEMQASLAERHQKGAEEAKRLQEQATLMNRRLESARRLIGGLSTERRRWGQELEGLKQTRGLLFGDCAIAAAFLSYTGPFSSDYREKLISKIWMPDVRRLEVPLTNDYSVISFLSDEVELAEWARDGLPSDSFSVQNGILTTRASSYPLCVDPQAQALSWLRKKLETNPRFEMATMADSDFMKRLEFAISYGNPFLIENIGEQIDPIIDNLLERNYVYEGPRKFVRFGDKAVEVDPNFRLYLVTKHANPKFMPEVFGKCAVINYSVTLQGLHAQLLNAVVAFERSDLEAQRTELVQTMAENKSNLKGLEESLIRELALATGNILDNDDLIATLEDTKRQVLDISAKLEVSRTTARGIESARLEYCSVAERGTVIFFVLQSLSAIGSMYCYSLPSFLSDVFKLSLERSEPNFDVTARLANITSFLTFWAYRYASMSLFVRNKPTLTFLLVTRVLSSEGSLDAAELDFLVRGNVAVTLEKAQGQKAHAAGATAAGGGDGTASGSRRSLLTDKQLLDINRLAKVIPACSRLEDQINANAAAWERWALSDTPEVDPPPDGYDASLTQFQRMCLLRCFRLDRVLPAVTSWVGSLPEFGPRFSEPPVIAYQDVFRMSTSTTPIVCIIAPGANPTTEVTKLADKLDLGASRLRVISLGQGQEAEAMRLVETGALRGQWVLLQNCHLLVDWLSDLEAFLDRRDRQTHPDHRLWLTSEESPNFPLGILQRALKVVNEPPNGLRANLKQTLGLVTEEVLTACAHPAYTPILYSLGFLHAIVLERRKYGKLGWNVLYDFGDTDFTVSATLIQTYLSKALETRSSIPWASLRYLVGDAMYGGRVTDSVDRRVLTTYLDEYFGDFLFNRHHAFAFFRPSELAIPPTPGSAAATAAPQAAAPSVAPASSRPSAAVSSGSSHGRGPVAAAASGSGGAAATSDDMDAPFTLPSCSLEAIHAELHEAESTGAAGGQRHAAVAPEVLQPDFGMTLGDGAAAPHAAPPAVGAAGGGDDGTATGARMREAAVMRAAWATHVDSIPQDVPTSVFGLHPNAEVMYWTTGAMSLFSDMLACAPSAPRGTVRGLIPATITTVTPPSNGADEVPEVVHEDTDAAAAPPAEDATSGAAAARAAISQREAVVLRLIDDIIGGLPEQFNRAAVVAHLRQRAAADLRAAAEARAGAAIAAQVAAAAAAEASVQSPDGDTAVMLTPTAAASAAGAPVVSVIPAQSAPAAGSGTTIWDGASSAAVTGGGSATLSPMHLVLVQEVDYWNKLLSTIRSTLSDLRRALVGSAPMSAQLDAIAEAMHNGQIPAAWRACSPPTRKPLGSWLQSLMRRHTQYSRWVSNGAPVVVWLSGLHAPEAFLSAVLLIACRKHGWALDRVRLSTRVTQHLSPRDVTVAPADGVYIHGISLEGARWDATASHLAVQLPRQLYADLPVLHIVPVEAARLKLAGTLRTPVYVNSGRRDAGGQGMVFEVDLPTTLHTSHWILQGTAAVLNTDD